MKTTFYDEKADLLWTTFNDFNNLSPNEYYFHDKFTQELNSWDNEGIRKYIIWDKEDKLGEKMNSFAEEPYAYKLFYALRGKHLVGMILTSPNTKLRNIEDMQDYVKECILDKSMGKENCLDLISAIKGLTFTKRNNLYIEYLVVRPDLQQTNAKIGQSMIQSIISNPEFFNNFQSPNFIITTIHKQNAPSQNVFENHHNFKKFDVENPSEEDIFKKFSSYEDYFLLNNGFEPNA